MTRYVGQVTVAILCLLGLPAGVVAQQPDPCEWLLKYGIYDEKSVSSGRHDIAHIKSLVQQSASFEQFEKNMKHHKLDVIIPDLGVLNFNSKTIKTDWTEWKTAFLNTSTIDLQSHAVFQMKEKKINAALMAAVTECIKNRKQNFVTGKLIPGDGKDSLFVLQIECDPRLLPAKVTSVTFLSSTRNFFNPLPKDTPLAKNALIPRESGMITVTFKREALDEEITVVVTTEKGDFFARILPAPQKRPETEKSTLKLQGKWRNNLTGKTHKVFQTEGGHVILEDAEAGTTFGYLSGDKIVDIQSTRFWSVKAAYIYDEGNTIKFVGIDDTNKKEVVTVTWQRVED